MRSIHTLIPLAFTLVACGGSSGSGSSTSAQAMYALSQKIASATASYGAQASGMTDVAACNADESGYGTQVRPMVEQMQGMGPTMDQVMSSMGNHADADMTCAASAMMAELDRHESVACASTSDMGPNEAEAAQHVTTMTQWADHEMVRSQAVGSMMGAGMGGMGGGGMATGHCVHNPDGSYGMQ